MPEAAVIFDLDGTLIDSAPDIHAAANLVVADYGFAPLSFEEIRSFVGRGLPHLVGCVLTARGRAADDPQHAEICSRFEAVYETAVHLTRPYPEVEATLERLVAEGYRLGICTNKPVGPTRAVLRHLNLAQFFPVVLGGDSLAVRKPDPAPLLQTLADLGGGAAVFVGDSEVDAETAERAALPFLLFTEGYRKSPVEALPHKAAFASFAELPTLVRQALA